MRFKSILLTVTALAMPIFAFSKTAPPVSPSVNPVKHLTLREAILLGLRFNANVRSAELDRVVQKYSLVVAQWAFEPHYAFTMKRQWKISRGDGKKETGQSWSATPSMGWTSPIGTTVSTGAGIGWGGGTTFAPSVDVDVIQPLIRGFGKAVVEADLQDAYDQEKVHKLTLKQTVMSQVTSTISAYMALVGAENSLDVDKESLARARTNLFQTRLLIKAGQNPRSDEVQAKSQIAQALAQSQADKNALTIARYQLLQAIGLKPSTKIQVSHIVPLQKYRILPEEQSVKSALANNVAYQTSVIGIASLTRSVLTAKDANRWQLNFEENYSRGGSGGDGSLDALDDNHLLNGGVNNILGNNPYGSTTSLTLTVPIHKLDNKALILSSKIALERAEMNLKQARQDLIIQTMSTRDSLLSQRTQIRLNQNQVNYDKETLENTTRRYRAGISSSYEVTQQSQTLAGDERTLVSSEMSYFTALAQFDQSYGHTLETWGIHVNY